MEVLLLIYNLLLQTLYCIPVVYAWILFQHTRKHLYLYITGLFFFYSIENIIIFITEFDTAFAKFYDTTFMSVPTSRTIIFVAVLLFILQITTSILQEKTNYILMSVLGIITLFMLFVPMMKDSAMKVFIYYTPCQLFSFLVGSYGINRLKIHPEYYNDDKLLRSQFHKAFLWTAIFSVLIIIEDWIVIFHFDNYGEQNIHITNRSYTENLMSIYYVFTTLRILAPYVQSLLGSSNAVPSSAADLKLQSVQTSDTPLEPPTDIPPGGSLTDIQELPSDTVYVNPDTFNERLLKLTIAPIRRIIPNFICSAEIISLHQENSISCSYCWKIRRMSRLEMTFAFPLEPQRRMCITFSPR